MEYLEAYINGAFIAWMPLFLFQQQQQQSHYLFLPNHSPTLYNDVQGSSLWAFVHILPLWLCTGRARLQSMASSSTWGSSLWMSGHEQSG